MTREREASLIRRLQVPRDDSDRNEAFQEIRYALQKTLRGFIGARSRLCIIAPSGACTRTYHGLLADHSLTCHGGILRRAR
jgi:hypothetical protein